MKNGYVWLIQKEKLNQHQPNRIKFDALRKRQNSIEEKLKKEDKLVTLSSPRHYDFLNNIEING